MAKRKKIIITESQLKVIKESENVIDDFRESMENIIKMTNAQFSRLAFASMADVLDNDIDLEAIRIKMNELHKVYNTKYQRAWDFINHRLSDDDYNNNPKWQNIDIEIDNLGNKVSNKIEAVSELVGVLDKLAEMDVEKYFDDIETRKV